MVEENALTDVAVEVLLQKLWDAIFYRSKRDLSAGQETMHSGGVSHVHWAIWESIDAFW